MENKASKDKGGTIVLCSYLLFLTAIGVTAMVSDAVVKCKRMKIESSK